MNTRTIKQAREASENRQRSENRRRSPLNVDGARPSAPSATAHGTSPRKRGCACGGSCPRCHEQSLIQRKLPISSPGDRYEQEADRVADRVLRMPAPVSHLPDEAESEEETKRQAVDKDKQEVLQTKPTSGWPSPRSRGIRHLLPVLRGDLGGGQNLPRSERAFFEPRLGYDLREVRVHTTTKADQANRLLNARAFTVGQDIFFCSGGSISYGSSCVRTH